MLTLTDNARHAVQDISQRAGLPDEGGLRIAESTAQVGNFELSLVPAPVEGDEVIEAEGARVFVEPTTSTVLADQQLDAAPSAEGTGFLLAPQG
ncbi:adhesin [Actinotalea sp. K2]|uniref:adhesin n=1 Tax=Actinotalea sp. K2 TaxID=2939438 RepID=UPI0020180EF0|nr:adhesin [Actinotalea sp. K2]MCL3863129.1 adhesin [Actinotalea sp. K2]